MQLGERECRQCSLTLRLLEGVRVRGSAPQPRAQRALGYAPPPPLPPRAPPHLPAPRPLPSLPAQSHGSAPGSGHRVLHFEVADDTDAFFLHTLTVGEAEYGALRASQALLVDFAGFPPHVLQLLEACVQARGAEQTKCVGPRRLFPRPPARPLPSYPHPAP